MPGAMTQLQLAWPYALLLLPLPWLLLLRLGNRSMLQRLRRFAEPSLWPWLLARPPGARGGLPGRGWSLAWLLTVLAISNPVVVTPPDGHDALASDVAIIMDLSPSMALEDITPDRLTHASTRVAAILAAQPGLRSALIGFSANPYRILPLTPDSTVVSRFLRALRTDLTRLRGSNLTGALEEGRRLLQRSERHSRAILLISDGGIHDRDRALQAAQRLGNQDIPLIVLGIGSRAGAPLRDEGGRFLKRDGQVVISKLDTALLTRLAQASGGRYLPLASSSDSAIADALAALQQRSRYRDEGVTVRRPLFHWLLFPALLLFLYSQIRSGSARRQHAALLGGALLLLGNLAVPLRAQASPLQEQPAWDALQQGRYQEAQRRYQDITSFTGRLGAGSAAYKQGDYRGALQAFREALAQAADGSERAVANYNRGNALLRLGRRDAAAAAWRAALTDRPQYKKAAYNLSLLEQWQAQQAQRQQSNSDGLPRRTTGQQPDQEGVMAHQEAAAENPSPRPDESAPDSATAGAVLQLREMKDSTEAVLRQRFAAQDSDYPGLREARPW